MIGLDLSVFGRDSFFTNNWHLPLLRHRYQVGVTAEQLAAAPGKRLYLIFPTMHQIKAAK